MRDTATLSRTHPSASAGCGRGDGTACGVGGVLRPLPTAEARSSAAELELLAHPIRLQLLTMLVREGEPVCVCDLEQSLPIKQPTVSHHLRLLRTAGLVTVERRGTFAHYRANSAAIGVLRDRISQRLSSLA